MKYGFTFIELLIGIAISSLIAGVLFFSFNQSQKASKVIEQMLSIEPTIMTISNQLEKDISGAFAPKFWFPQETSEKKSDIKPFEELKKPEEKKPIQPQKEEYQKIDKLFFSENLGENLKELTFITCNPLQAFDNYKPRMARVLYRFVPDEQSKGAYRLLRKESLNIDFAKFNAEKNTAPGVASGEAWVEYELGSNIKHFSVSYIFPEESKKEKQPPSVKPVSEAKKEEITYKTVSSWDNSKDKSLPDVPQFVIIKITLWDMYQEDEYEFELRYQIFAFEQSATKEEKAKQQAGSAMQRERSTTQSPGATPGAAGPGQRPTIGRPGLGDLIR
ncbi:hypothetical protein A3F66_06490 [candidate division TM6 bacterium RIFCSPHIGHO2_12_FULL_32_22]|nr:MAG: hypothetical protein A3F66_06490 [candidate division TM6 bacterium RIFCSPHIGHO2_12_FULL_32_22]